MLQQYICFIYVGSVIRKTCILQQIFKTFSCIYKLGEFDMQLFDNFDFQPPNYVPNNMFPRIPEVQIRLNEDTVHPMFKKGELTGYWWNWGDKVTIEIKNQVHITLPAGAITVYEEGEEPTPETVGDFPGQKYYNLKDIKSWTFDTIVDDDFNPDNGVLYVWIPDKDFTYPKNGEVPIDVAMPFEEGDQIVVQLFNFRKELLCEQIYDTPECTWQLTPEESKELHPGIYYLNISMQNVYEEQISDLRLTNCYEIYVKGF